MRNVLRACRAWAGVELSPVSPKEKLISGAAGFLAILLLAAVSQHTLFGHAEPLIGSMAASAVLLFAVPHGQLSQPWPMLGGHVISATIGVACARWFADPSVAAAIAVGTSILAMHQLKCIHPPGGATALIAVMGGPAIRNLGFEFVLHPVLTNAAAMVGIAVVLNGCFAWRRYPASRMHHPAPLPVHGVRPPPSHEEIVRALRTLDSFVDITEDDLLRLVQILSKPAPTKSSESVKPAHLQYSEGSPPRRSRT